MKKYKIPLELIDLQGDGFHLYKEGEAEALGLAPDRALELSRRVTAAWQSAMNDGHDKVVLLTDFRLRLENLYRRAHIQGEIAAINEATERLVATREPA